MAIDLNNLRNFPHLISNNIFISRVKHRFISRLSHLFQEENKNTNLCFTICCYCGEEFCFFVFRGKQYASYALIDIKPPYVFYSCHFKKD